jgi:cell division protein FtsB
MNSDVLTHGPRATGPAEASTSAERTRHTDARQPDARRPARPGRRPRPGWPAQPPKSPVRPASPVRPPGPGRSGRPAGTIAAEPADRRTRPAGHPRVPAAQPSPPRTAQAGQVRRTSFVLLLLGLLGGGLVCLLVVNTTLAANSIEISNLQQQNAARSQRIEQLQQQIAAERSATTIEKEARRLGMRPDPELIFVNLRTKSIEGPRAADGTAAAAASGWPPAGAAGGHPLTGRKAAAGRPGQ